MQLIILGKFVDGHERCAFTFLDHLDPREHKGVEKGIDSVQVLEILLHSDPVRGC
jgi:hypothetical protein